MCAHKKLQTKDRVERQGDTRRQRRQASAAAGRRCVFNVRGCDRAKRKKQRGVGGNLQIEIRQAMHGNSDDS